MNEPWHTEDFPELRSAPPWVMQEMIQAQPALVAELLSSPPQGTSRAAEMIGSALAAGRPVSVVGCGTSEHAAAGIAALLRAAADPQHAWLIRGRAAFAAALEPLPGVCIAVSHDGGTRASTLALQEAASAGAETLVITSRANGETALAANHVLTTPRHDESWCHTLAYTSALATGAALAAAAGRLAADPASAEALLREAISTAAAADLAAGLRDRRVVLCAGVHNDHTTARELALKIAEGSRLPTVGLELETVTHGQLAGQEATDGLVLVAISDHPQSARIARRAGHVASAAAAIGMPVMGLLSSTYADTISPGLTSGGRVVIDLPAPDSLDGTLAGLLAGAGMLQALTLALVHERETNPDLIRREQTPYRLAAEAAESDKRW
ncbi:MAG: SIS domain-containing protein [Solirubrobacteraceae bacterium]